MRDPVTPGEFIGEVPQGVGVTLTINGRTRAMDRFFGNLPSGYGIPIDPLSAHVTLLYADETAIDIQSERDLIALQKTGVAIHKTLAGLPLQEMVLHPDGDELEKYGRYLAIPLRTTPFMRELRGKLAEIVDEELGVKIDTEGDSDLDLHMSVVRPRRSRVKIGNNLPPFPTQLHINGSDTQRRLMTGNQKKPTTKPKYINSPNRGNLRSVV